MRGRTLLNCRLVMLSSRYIMRTHIVRVEEVEVVVIELWELDSEGVGFEALLPGGRITLCTGLRVLVSMLVLDGRYFQP